MDLPKAPNFCSYLEFPLITHTLPKEHGSNKQTGGKKKLQQRSMILTYKMSEPLQTPLLQNDVFCA